MQNVGFLYMLLPILRETLAPAQLPEAVRRHVQFFNTHPYFSSTVLGAVARLEEEGAANPASPAYLNMSALKLGLMGSLGAIGDSLFWAALRPLGAWIAVILMMTGHTLMGVAAFLTVYNVPHLLVRFGGAAVGYAAGVDVVRQLRRVDFPHLTQRLKGLAVACAFAALPLVAWRSGTQGWVGPKTLAVAAVTGFVLMILRGSGGTRLAAGYLSVCLAVVWIWNALGGPH